MTGYRIKNSKLQGEISIPPSKSQTLRAILFASLARGKSVIRNPLDSLDTHAMIAACRLFGANIDLLPGKIEVSGLAGKIHQAEDVINAGNSGIVLRFCTALGALAPLPIVVTGDHSIRHQRPMQPLIEAFLQLGISAVSTKGDGYAPIVIQGPFQSGKTMLSGEDSQHVSALLIASVFSQGTVDLHVENPGEKPWVALTLDWFDFLGIPYINHQYLSYRTYGNAVYDGFDYSVPGDLSSAAFPVAAALVTGSEVLLQNIDLKDRQGDKELMAVFQKMGAEFEVDGSQKTLRVKKCSELTGVSVDVNDFIDAVPVLTAVACYASGETRIENAAIARHKECNRLRSIVVELRKMGACIEETSDGLTVQKSALRGANVCSYSDHRMAMSLAVAALAAEGSSFVAPVQCVAKTFPSFKRDFNRLGASIEELPLEKSPLITTGIGHGK